jgi:RimJ/RimL family protein N-acetyltransferase
MADILAGAHVRLEPLTLQHLAALCEVGLAPELWRWTTGSVATLEDMRDYIEAALAAEKAGTATPYATVEQKSGRVVGSTRFMNIDRANKRVEIGSTWVAPEWQRTAVNTEAKYLMFRHAFEDMGCIRVELKTDALNEQSRRAILRIGAKEEGIFRNHMICYGGRIRDSVYFSVIDSEWPAVKAAMEARLAAKLAPAS